MNVQRSRRHFRGAIAAALRLLVLLSSLEDHIVITEAQVLQGNNTLCNILTFIPFTDLREGLDEAHTDPFVPRYGYGTWPDQYTLAKASFSLMAAAEMARIHFNRRNSVIVTELATLTKGCNIRFPVPIDDTTRAYVDSSYNRRKSVNTVLAFTQQKQQPPPPQPVLDDNLCAILGPIDPAAVEGVNVLATAASNIPHLAYGTLDSRLQRQDEMPTLLSILPQANDFASIVAKYLARDVWHREFVAVVYDENDYGTQFVSPLVDSFLELNTQVIAAGFVGGDDATMVKALDTVVQHGFHTIILVTDRQALLDNIARIADERGLLGNDYFWILSGAAIIPEMMSTVYYDMNSPADRLLRGSALFTNYDPFVYLKEKDVFLQEWRHQDSTFVTRLNAIQPRTKDGKRFFVAESGYFQLETPTQYASFLYDAVMAAGIGACQAAAAARNRTQTTPANAFAPTPSTPRNSSTTSSARGSLHYAQILRSNFTGASGPVQFKYDGKQYQATRDPQGIMFGMYNIRDAGIDNFNRRTYATVLTSLYEQNNTYTNPNGTVEHGAWMNVPGTKFIFRDYSSDEPMPKRTIADMHYLSRSAQYNGFGLAGTALLSIIYSALWIMCHLSSRTVAKGEPEYLVLLCFGAGIVTISILLVSFDEDKFVSHEQLDMGCMAFPWFFVLGYLIIYAAIFSKLWCLNHVKRRVQKARYFLIPFLLIVLLSIVVLLVWQLVDPYKWQRRVVSLEPLETYGDCYVSNHGLLYYVLPLGVLVALAMFVTGYFAWKLKDAQSALAEGKWMFFAVLTHVQVWIVGIPIFVVTRSRSKDNSYLVMTVLVVLLSFVVMGFVIWPHMYTHYKEKRERRKGKVLPNRVADGTTSSITSSHVKAANDEVAALKREIQALEMQLKDKDDTDGFLTMNPHVNMEDLSEERDEEEEDYDEQLLEGDQEYDVDEDDDVYLEDQRYRR